MYCLEEYICLNELSFVLCTSQTSLDTIQSTEEVREVASFSPIDWSFSNFYFNFYLFRGLLKCYSIFFFLT